MSQLLNQSREKVTRRDFSPEEVIANPKQVFGAGAGRMSVSLTFLGANTWKFCWLGCFPAIINSTCSAADLQNCAFGDTVAVDTGGSLVAVGIGTVVGICASGMPATVSKTGLGVAFGTS